MSRCVNRNSRSRYRQTSPRLRDRSDEWGRMTRSHWSSSDAETATGELLVDMIGEDKVAVELGKDRCWLD